MIKKPLVLNNGNLEQLQDCDRLIPVQNTLELLNDKSVQMEAGSPVCIELANIANTTKTSDIDRKDAIALACTIVPSNELGIFQVDGKLTLTTTQWDIITEGIGGLLPGKVYFLAESATSGKISHIPPSTLGHYIVKLGIAISTTEFQIMIGTPIKL